MPYTCKLIASPELDERGNVAIEKREVGDMWFLEVSQEELQERHLSDYYFANNAGRKPLVVMLPGRNYFLIDGMCYSAEKGYYDGWVVTGAPPNITVQPSIDMKGRYHGHLTNGVLSDSQ